MSSNYQAICLSHDPALLVGDYSGHQSAADALTEGRAAHPRCVLVVGRWSGGLVEVCCPAQTPHTGQHSDDRWTSAGWLRLLALADPAAVAEARPSYCWSRDMANRLRAEL